MSFWKFLKEYWIIFAFATQIVFNYAGYVAFKDSITKDFTQVVTRVEKLEARSVSDALIVSEINSRLASMETSLRYIERLLK